jgi:nucleoside-diphosphate-sugar epimerase
MTVLVTGGSGFVGQAVASELIARKCFRVRTTTRNSRSTKGQSSADVVVMELRPETDWSRALVGVDVVVHTAARVHVMNDKSTDPLADFRFVNVESTVSLAQQAATAGVRRFVFLSTVKVNRESTEVGSPLMADDVPCPMDPYAVSKLEAEELLRQIAHETGMEVVIIRPPLVYGPSVKANFESMMRWLDRGIPLPLAALTQNRRSFVALDNLVDLIVICMHHSAAANQTFLVSDGEDLSTADLLKRMAVALGRSAKLYYIPPALLMLGAVLVRKTDIYQRLCGSLQLDIMKTREVLGWTPLVSVDEGLRRAAASFRL